MLRTLASLSLAALLLAACGPAVSVSVEPASATLAPGKTLQLTAKVEGSSNTAVKWTVQEGASGGEVSAAGLYTAPATPGTFHVIATAEADASKSATVTLTVSAEAGVRVTLSPSTATVAAGETKTFTATVTGTAEANANVTWTVQEGAAGGTVSASGVYTAPSAPGTFHVVATSVADQTAKATATVTVTPLVGVQVQPATATVKVNESFTFTAVISGTGNQSAEWSVEEGASGGAVTQGGVYTAPATPGTFHVVARSAADNTKLAKATVTVVPGVVVDISPKNPTVGTLATRAFTATVTGSSNTAVTWSVVEAGGGTLSAAGLYTAPATPGSYTVKAVSAADATAVATTTVTVEKKITVTINPSTASVEVLDLFKFSATVLGATNPALTWTVDEGATGGQVDNTGLYRAPSGVGVFHVTARSVEDPAQSDTATITVTPQMFVEVNPFNVSLAQGATQQFTATVVGVGNPAVTWSVQGGAANGTISATGLYTAPTVKGSYTVMATSVGAPAVKGYAYVTVVSPVKVVVSPATVQLSPSQTQQFTATVTGAPNTAVTWTASGGTVTSGGLFTAPAATGAYTVTATSVADPSVKASATATVLGAPVSVSGTVAYAGTKTGRIYLALSDTNGDVQLGTSLAGPGAFTIRGLRQPGGYTLSAFRDVVGSGHFANGVDPAGSVAFNFTGAAVTGLSVTLTDPPAPSLAAPQEPFGFAGDGVVALLWNGSEDETSEYRIYWNDDPATPPGPSSKLGSLTVRASPTPLTFISGLTNGVAVRFAVAAVEGGQEGAPSQPSMPITPTAPAGGGALSTQVTFTGLAPAPIYALAIPSSPTSFNDYKVVRVANPVSPQTVTVAGLSPGHYSAYVFFDRGRPGEFEPTDPTNVFSQTGPLSLGTSVTGTATVAGPPVTFSAADGLALAPTEATRVAGADSYRVNLRLGTGAKLPSSVALLSGPGVAGVMDLAYDATRSGAELTLPRGSAPVAGDTYAFAVTYADGTTANLNAVVSRVLPFPASFAGTAAATPTFSWSFAAALPTDARLFVDTQETGSGFPGWVSTWLPSTATSIVYNADGLAPTATLMSGTQLTFGLNVQDAAGNRSRAVQSLTVP